MSSVFFFLDQLYMDNDATSTGIDAGSSDPSSNAGYGTFYPECNAAYSSPSVSTSNSNTTKEASYQSMPPPADQESPYSYGYGDEKKKMLTQSQNEGQTGDYSMYSTAYPTSVTGGQGYSNYGEYSESMLKMAHISLILLPAQMTNAEFMSPSNNLV